MSTAIFNPMTFCWYSGFLINGDQNIKFLTGGCQQQPIFETLETSLFDSRNPIFCKVTSERPRYTLVKQQPHGPQRP